MVKKLFGRKKKAKKCNNEQCEIPSIIVECPSGIKVQYLDETNFVQIETNNNNNNCNDDSDVRLSSRCNGLRRKSISLPNIGDLDLKTLNNVVSRLLLEFSGNIELIFVLLILTANLTHVTCKKKTFNAIDYSIRFVNLSLTFFFF